MRSSCESVHIISTVFQTEDSNDVLTINGIRYSNAYGKPNSMVNQIVPTNFTVYFMARSFSGWRDADVEFLLNWSCTQWGEWTPFYDGTCRTHVKRPSNNGQTTIGDLKYKSMSTCRKLLY